MSAMDSGEDHLPDGIPNFLILLAVNFLISIMIIKQLRTI